MLLMLEIISIVLCILAVIYPLAAARHYYNTNKLGNRQMWQLIGEAFIMSVTTAFALLQLTNLLPDVSAEVQSLMRIAMSAVAVYTSYRLHKILRHIVEKGDDGSGS